MKQRSLFGMALLAILLLAVLIAPLANTPATAAPAAVVTPVASINLPGVRGDVVTFLSTSVFTSDGCSPLQAIQDHSLIDLQWVIDQGTVNTTTFSLRWTNTGSTANLVTDATVVSANAADATSGGQFALFGRQACIYHDVANTNPLTATFIGVAK